MGNIEIEYSSGPIVTASHTMEIKYFQYDYDPSILLLNACS
jgi:hypothetical protein